MLQSFPTEIFLCHACEYDLRTQPAEGVCPECGAAVAESKRLAAIPRRPAWRDSDPRWRRRMLAGAWILVLAPLMAALQTFGWASSVPVPTLSQFQGAPSLDDSYVTYVYGYLTFCIGVVLLFAKERNRRTSRLDWTQRWGVIASYGVFLLGIPVFAFIGALVMLGIAALFQSMPPQYQPAVTDLLVPLGAGYMHYGPHPSPLSDAALAVFSSVVVLLACVPLYNALRSSGPKVLATILLLAPLVLSSLVQITYAGRYLLNFVPPSSFAPYLFYFSPKLLAGGFAAFWENSGSWSFIGPRFILEAAKWFAFLAIAVWLSVTQIAAMCRRGRIG